MNEEYPQGKVSKWIEKYVTLIVGLAFSSVIIIVQGVGQMQGWAS